MTDLKMGQKYEVTCNYYGKDEHNVWKKYKGKVIYLDYEIVVFNTGLFNICQMIKDYKKLWRARAI